MQLLIKNHKGTVKSLDVSPKATVCQLLQEIKTTLNWTLPGLRHDGVVLAPDVVAQDVLSNGSTLVAVRKAAAKALAKTATDVVAWDGRVKAPNSLAQPHSGPGPPRRRPLD